MLVQDVDGDVQLFSVYVPTNHIYVGDVFLLGKQDIIKVNLSVREGLGMQHLSIGLPPHTLLYGHPCNEVCNKLHHTFL